MPVDALVLSTENNAVAVYSGKQNLYVELESGALIQRRKNLEKKV